MAIEQELLNRRNQSPTVGQRFGNALESLASHRLGRQPNYQGIGNEEMSYMEKELMKRQLDEQFLEKKLETQGKIDRRNQLMELEQEDKYLAEKQKQANEQRLAKIKEAEAIGKLQSTGQPNQSQQQTTHQPMQSPMQAPTTNSSMPFDAQSPFIQLPGQVKYSPDLGVYTEQGAYEKNPEYLSPQDRQDMADAEEQKNLKDEMTRASAVQQLQAIRGARKGTEEGSEFFGPYGGTLPSTFMGFPNPLVGTSMPGGSKVSDRTMWEANLENLKAQKMIDTMMKMKEASKTGATGFGQLSEAEGQILRDASMRLRRELAPEDARLLLDQLEAIQMKQLDMELSPEQQQILEAINTGNDFSGGGEVSEEQRYNELIASGMPEDEVYKQLAKEY